MSLIINGAAEDFSSLITASWYDVPNMRVGRMDRRPRITRWIRSIIIHTTQGDEPATVLPGVGPTGLAARTVNGWQTDDRHAGSHIIIDGDGSIWCLADLVKDATYHASSINEVSIGIELSQTSKLETWDSQYVSLILLLDCLTARLGIQRQFHAPYRGDSSPVPRLSRGGGDCVGIFGHRDQTGDRGQGDPGNRVFEYLVKANYEAFDFAQDHDKEVWKLRQTDLGLIPDGVPGQQTCRALQNANHPNGIWIPRP